MLAVVLSLVGTVLRFRGGSDSASATSLIGQLQSLKATVGEPKLVGLLQQNTALQENVEELERLLRHTLDGPDENGLSRLHCATIEQDAERCESLLRAGADPEVKASGTPLASSRSSSTSRSPPESDARVATEPGPRRGFLSARHRPASPGSRPESGRARRVRRDTVLTATGRARTGLEVARQPLVVAGPPLATVIDAIPLRRRPFRGPRPCCVCRQARVRKISKHQLKHVAVRGVDHFSLTRGVRISNSGGSPCRST